MDIQYIETFICVAEIGNFTKAATHLNYAQSTVTMQIQQLERELGYPLFDRIGKKISLTVYGKEFMRYAKEILHIKQRACFMGKNSENMNGKLRIGTIESLLFNTIIDILPVYRKQYPNIKIEINTGGTAEQLDSLRSGQIDIAYVTSRINSGSDLLCCYQRKEKSIFVASPQHKLAKKDNLSLEDIFRYPMVVTERCGTSYGILMSLANANKLVFNDYLIIDSIIGIIKFLQKDIAISFLVEYMALESIERGDLVRLDVDVEPEAFHSKIFHHKSKWIAPFLEGFIDLIRKSRPEY